MEHKAEVNHILAHSRQRKKASDNITLEKEAVSSFVLIEKFSRFGISASRFGFLGKSASFSKLQTVRHHFKTAELKEKNNKKNLQIP